MHLTRHQASKPWYQGQQGLTLIELMIVVIIISILVTVALPAYQELVQKSRRADARNALLSAQLAMEKYRGGQPVLRHQYRCAGCEYNLSGRILHPGG